jgi:hypothetical protein
MMFIVNPRLTFIVLFFIFAAAILCGQIWFEGNVRGLFQFGGGIGWLFDKDGAENRYYADVSFSIFDPLEWFWTANLGARFDPTDSVDTRIFTEIVFSQIYCIGVGGTWGPASGKWSIHVMGGILLPLFLLGFDLDFSGPSAPPNPCILFIPNAILFIRLGTEEFSSVFCELGFKLKWCFWPIDA